MFQVLGHVIMSAMTLRGRYNYDVLNKTGTSVNLSKMRELRRR